MASSFVSGRRPLLAGALALGLGALGPAAASAQDARPPSAEAVQAAAKAFAEGEKAFAAKDYALAASRFAEANRLAPHPNALWNEAQSLLKAGDKPGSASLLSRYVKTAPADARDRAEATRTLDLLSKSLLRIDLVAAGFDTVLVDDRRVEPGAVYVEPGRHRVEAHAGAGVAGEEVNGKAGEIVPVELVVPRAAPTSASTPAPAPASTPAPASGPASAPAPTPAPAPAPSPSHGWSPAVVYATGGVAVVLLGLAAWSGVDTLDYKSTYDDASPAQKSADYSTGVSKMNRTNVLLAFGGGVAVFTGIAALALVDWHGGSATVGLGPGSIELRGAFR